MGLCAIHEEGTNATRPDCASDRAASLRNTAFVWYLADRKHIMGCSASSKSAQKKGSLLDCLNMCRSFLVEIPSLLLPESNYKELDLRALDSAVRFARQAELPLYASRFTGEF